MSSIVVEPISGGTVGSCEISVCRSDCRSNSSCGSVSIEPAVYTYIGDGTVGTGGYAGITTGYPAISKTIQGNAYTVHDYIIESCCTSNEDHDEKEKSEEAVLEERRKAWDKCLKRVGGGVKDVKVYNDRAVVVTFEDGTSTRAVVDKDDVFCLETGITVCLMKKLLGGQEDGTRMYCRLLRKAVKTYNDGVKKDAEDREKAEAEKQKKRKAELKRAAKRLRRKEEAIDIQKQGFLRAMQERDWHNDDLK